MGGNLWVMMHECPVQFAPWTCSVILGRTVCSVDHFILQLNLCDDHTLTVCHPPDCKMTTFHHRLSCWFMFLLITSIKIIQWNYLSCIFQPVKSCLFMLLVHLPMFVWWAFCALYSRVFHLYRVPQQDVVRRNRAELVGKPGLFRG